MFSDDEKKVFAYESAAGPVRADPVALQRRLNQLLGGNVGEVIERHNGPKREDGGEGAMGVGIVAMSATDRLVEASRIAFGLPWDDGRGPDEDAVLAVLDGFHKWLDQKKTSGEKPPTSPPPSVSGSTD